MATSPGAPFTDAEALRVAVYWTLLRFAVALAVVGLAAALGGCCSTPDRLDPKKVAAFRDEVAGIGSLAILWAPAAQLPAVKTAVAHANADAEVMTR